MVGQRKVDEMSEPWQPQKIMKISLENAEIRLANKISTFLPLKTTKIYQSSNNDNDKNLEKISGSKKIFLD